MLHRRFAHIAWYSATDTAGSMASAKPLEFSLLVPRGLDRWEIEALNAFRANFHSSINEANVSYH